jgi:hypothetical protein
MEDESVTDGSGYPQQPLKKNGTEELQLKMTAAACISEDKHIQIQRRTGVKKCTTRVQQKIGTEKLTSADKDALSDCRAASTVDSCKVLESSVEEEVDGHRSSSIDVLDEETDFVKL